MSYHYHLVSTKTTLSGTSTYSYGSLGELKTVHTPEHNITYLHNALNQRVAKEVDGEIVEKYLWQDLTRLLAVYDKDDTLVQRFEYADQRMPVSMTQGNEKYYLHYDQVGSLRAITDAQHTIVKEIVYDSYGNILTDSNEAFTIPFGFAGGLYDADIKLTRFGYRDYDAYTGKWTAKDPIGFDGGDFNLYGYVLGDPVGFYDPFGLYIDPRLKGKVPRAMGGDGGISNADAIRNSTIAGWTVGAGAFAGGWSIYGFWNTFNFTVSCIMNYQTLSDGIHNTDKARGKRSKTVEQLAKDRRKKGLPRGFPKIKF